MTPANYEADDDDDDVMMMMMMMTTVVTAEMQVELAVVMILGRKQKMTKMFHITFCRK